MALEIRPYRPEETEAFYRVPSIVFGRYNARPHDASQPGQMPPDWSLCAFEDGELATAYGAYPFTIRMNGAPNPVAGVSYVGTLPWHRRKGHLRKIVEADFRRRYEQREQPMAMLLASVASIYQRYGYAVVSTRTRYSIDPRWISTVPSLPKPRGSWREASRDELPLIKDLYREFVAPRTGYLHRASVMWDSQILGGMGPVFGGPEDAPSLLNVYEEDGKPQGYLAYAAKEYQEHEDGAGPGQRVLVRELIGLQPSAHIAAWQMLRTFDLARRVQMYAGPDDPAFDILQDPRELNATKGDWLLARIIDVERELTLRPYGAEGRVVFELRDEMCPWNADRWALEAGPEGGSMSRTKESPQLTLDVSALAQLLFGHVSPSRAVRIGRAEASPDAPLTLWDDIWRTAYAPFCPDGF